MNRVSQIHRKSFKNRPLDCPWDLFGATLEPLGKHLGHMLPKDWILEALGRALGVQDSKFGSNLDAQDLPKSRQEHEKLDVKKHHVFCIDFGRVRTSFWKGFWQVFWGENARKLKKNEFNENLKNRDFT